MTKFKFVFMTILTQKYLIIWPYMSYMIFGTALIESLGDIKHSI